jgi:hypothetical protein
LEIASHKVVIPEGVIVRAGIGNGPAAHTDKCGLGLRSLGFLTALLSGLLFLHLLVAQGRQGAGDLLDLVTGKILGKLFGKLLQEESIVRFLRVAGNDRNQCGAQGLELGLGVGVEEGERRDVDRVVGILGVDDNSGASCGSLAGVANTDFGEEILGVLQVGLLLGLPQALALLGFGLLVA